MPDFIIEINGLQGKKNLKERVKAYLRRSVFIEKLNNPAGYFLLLILSFCTSFITIKMGYSAGLALIAALIGAPILFACMVNLRFGIAVILTLAFFLIGATRIIDLPLGVANDVILAVMLFGLVIKQTEEHDWKFANNPISKAILIWILYNILEVANPTAESRLAWVYTIRSMAGIMLMYFIVIYTIKEERQITFLIKLWLFLAMLATLYGLFQEYYGLLPFENAWIMEEPKRYKLLFVMGHMRKFSFLSDPAVFGFLMAYSGIMCAILATGPFRKWKRITLAVMSALMMLSMVYSGTRAAYAVLPAGVLFYTLLKMNKKILIAAGVFFFFGLIIVNMPTNNANLVRLQTAFRPEKDVSYQVRADNQKFIQPFIQSHPLGGGLGSTGVWGERFSPNSPLAKFPPDSGYMRIAVEMGWIGLLLYCILLYTVFHIGVKDYIRIKNPRLKVFSAAMLTALFSLVVANFPQQAIGQIPTSLFFFIAVAIINKTREFDNALIKSTERRAVTGQSETMY